jgi:hypothetical protein
MLKIYTSSHKRPDFIELQLKSFQKHLQEDFILTILNNAHFDLNDKQIAKQIRSECERLGLPMIDVIKEQTTVDHYQSFEACPLFTSAGEYYNACIACAYPLAWAWDNYIVKEKGPILFIESDMFLMTPVRLTDYLQKYQIIYVPQSSNTPVGRSAEHMHSGFFLADLSQIPEPESINWWCGKAEGIPVDVGGQTFCYLRAHPELTRLHVKEERIYDDPQVDFAPANYMKYWLETTPTILHYVSGSNWNHQSNDYHAKKTIWLKKVLAL